jgi:hypothetical protein
VGYNEDMLKCAELKYLGEYLMSGGAPGPEALSRSETEKQLLDRAYGRLEASLAGLGEPAAEPIRRGRRGSGCRPPAGGLLFRSPGGGPSDAQSDGQYRNRLLEEMAGAENFPHRLYFFPSLPY